MEKGSTHTQPPPHTHNTHTYTHACNTCKYMHTQWHTHTTYLLRDGDSGEDGMWVPLLTSTKQKWWHSGTAKQFATLPGGMTASSTGSRFTRRWWTVGLPLREGDGWEGWEEVVVVVASFGWVLWRRDLEELRCVLLGLVGSVTRYSFIYWSVLPWQEKQKNLCEVSAHLKHMCCMHDVIAQLGSLNKTTNEIVRWTSWKHKQKPKQGYELKSASILCPVQHWQKKPWRWLYGSPEYYSSKIILELRQNFAKHSPLWQVLKLVHVPSFHSPSPSHVHRALPRCV